ncbi:MAG: putative terminase large subunit [Prokaryotic dsDNA virus sp.]|nr:MAG: putative terminase large subunit [Prokaryotic dsDNA virus sp.]|tara:strand:- start:8682 stop:9839 length:1158 start_codon:yes stop_codon:yes gene_type:complete
MQISLKTNIVFKHLVNSQKKIIVNQGGTRSGKTFNILLYIIFYYCLNNSGKTITICRKTYPALRATVLRDFINILREQNLYSEDNHNKSSSEYNLFGNLIEFISLDQPVKVRGRKRDLLFINEANELYWEDWQQLLFRTSEKIILDYNPSEEYHWIYDKIIPREDADFLKTTYKDNPFLEQALIKEIERLQYTDEQYWQIYGLGEKGISKATIFNYVECNQIPEDADFVSMGMDFGFTNDPTALVSVWKKESNLYIKELLYRTMMTTGDIHSYFKQIITKELIYADSSEPRIIEELRRMGWKIRASLKGRDSVNAGIDLLKRFKIHIHKDSTNAIQEFRNYKWKEDKTGKLTNTPEDKNNHITDAVRYATYSILSKPNFGRYAIQ